MPEELRSPVVLLQRVQDLLTTTGDEEGKGFKSVSDRQLGYACTSL